MLDIKFIRENAKFVKDNIKKKFQDEKLPLVDRIIKIDADRLKLLHKSQKLRTERNLVSKKINELKKAKKDASKEIKKAQSIPEKIKIIEEELATISKEILDIQIKIPNIIHKDVPLGEDDTKNKEVKKHGKKRSFNFEIKSHLALIEDLGMADFESSARVAGTGFYYIQGNLALLNQALLAFARDTMISKGYLYVETPLMLREEIIDQVTDLHDKKNQIFLVEDEPKMALIGTSEHSLIGRYAGQCVDANELPIKQTSYSMCFRKEIGAHGIDEKGLFRSHQFNKIEMIVICQKKYSEKFWKDMQNITVEIFKKLDIPIRVLEICSGDLGDLKQRQVDIEAFSPRRNEYIEVGSCSNLTESQARKLNISTKINGERIIPHTLNNTAIATSRALVALIENNQNKDGSISIPKVLHKYMNGVKKLE